MINYSDLQVKRSRTLYLWEAAFEYLISLLVSSSFLATLTKELGVSDSLTGILSSVISLGCLFQLISLAIRRTAVKRFVITFSILNQILFMLLYVVPLTGFGKQTKIVLFVAFIFSAYLIYNIAHPKKINWLMSLVDPSQRGRFTATKEIISLVSGMIFSFGMGAVIDHLAEKGQIRAAFTVSALVIFALMILHTCLMAFAVEKPAPQASQKKLKTAIVDLLKSKNILHITIVFLMYYTSTYISTPFYGTYQISELGLSLKFVSLITIVGNVARILVARLWGTYADKTSFAVMVEKCFILLGLSKLCIVFATPALGKTMFILFYILNGMALGGIGSALINLVLEYMPAEKAADAIAVTQAFSGLAGFLTTLCISPVVSHIQKSNTLFGMSIYAQQFVSVIALAISVFAVFYIRFVFMKKVQKPQG